jgi:hypothetical protein
MDTIDPYGRNKVNRLKEKGDLRKKHNKKRKNSREYSKKELKECH